MAKAERQKPAENWKEIFITALLKSSNVAAAFACRHCHDLHLWRR